MFLQRRFLDGEDSVDDKRNLHHCNDQENLHDFILVERQRVIFVDDDTGNHRTKNSAEQLEQSVEAGGHAALVLWHFIGDNRAPGGVGNVISELEQQEDDSEGNQQFG